MRKYGRCGIWYCRNLFAEPATWECSDRREECIMIAKLLGKLSFTRNYGAYGCHDWGTHTGDDRV
ncbi:hypothetical protein GZL_01627 [Streptomyces sp. 769]|nr:hypothetical protein GZL_01627 [Streptomyces sp. 769]